MKNAPVLHRLEFGAFLALKGLLRALPHPASRAFGAGFGAFAHRVDARHRRVVDRNLALAFPTLEERERRALTRACFRHVGASFADAVSIQRFDHAELCRRVTATGWEHLRAAEALGRGTLIMGAHLGNWEVVALTIGALHGPLQAVGRPADNPWFDRELQRLRTRFGNISLAKHGSVRRMLRALKEGGRVGMLIDQRVKPHEGIAVPFLGTPCWTSPLLAQLALRTGAPIVPAFGDHRPGGCYEVRFLPPVVAAGPETDAAIADLTIDFGTRRVVRTGRAIELTAKEFALLECLAVRAGQVVDRATITAYVWDENHDPFTNVLEVLVRRLRRKIDDGREPKLIHTMRGAGYRLSE